MSVIAVQFRKLDRRAQTAAAPLDNERNALIDQSGLRSEDFEALWREAPCGLVTLDARLTALKANPIALLMIGRPVAEVVGAPFPDLLSVQTRPEFLRAMDRRLREPGGIEELALTIASPGRASLSVEAQARADERIPLLHLCLTRSEGGPSHHRSMTARRREAELAASIVSASTDAILSLSSDGRILSWNHGAEQLYGYSAAEAIGQSLDFLAPPERLPESEERRRRVFEGQNVYFETERRHKDGTLVPVAISGGPIFDGLGKPVGIAAIHRDIRAQIRHEAQLRFVMRELAHRTKNLLAIIQSIERQTARAAVNTEEFHERFSSRLQALAASHDLLVETNWGGAPIGDLIERQLAAFSDQIGGRILLTGPSMLLSPSVAQTIGLAVHELATNATKYGALSISTGRVAVSWGVFPDEGGKPRFRIEWRESGGPPVSPPRQRGFGSLAIERLAAQALNGEAELIYAPEGLRWTLSSDPSDVGVGG